MSRSDTLLLVFSLYAGSLPIDASAQTTIGGLVDVKDPQYAKERSLAHNAYSGCIFDHMITGTKLELGQSGVDTVIATCEGKRNIWMAVEERLMPPEQRAMLHKSNASATLMGGVHRFEAVETALTEYYRRNAGGQPADSTARSK